MLNYKGCAKCASKELREAHVEQEEDDGLVTLRKFQHECEQCGHAVAEHLFTLEIDEELEAHLMEMRCALCGIGDCEYQYGF